MPRARIVTCCRAVICASIALSLTAIDAGVALAADASDPALQASAPARYQVRKGDSLSSIARRNGVSVAALAAANNIQNVRLILVGQWLVIPGLTPPAPPGGSGGSVVGVVLLPASAPDAPAVPIAAAAVAPASPAPVTYVLRRGDSLSRVARKFNVTVQALTAANRITNPNRVPIGLRLVIPGSAPAAGPAALPSAPTTTVAIAPAVATSDPSTTSVPVAVSDTTTTTTFPASTTVPAAAVAAAPSLSAEQLARLPRELLNLPERLALLPSFDRWAAEYAVPPNLLKALAWMESGWQAQVISPSGAIGIGQLLPSTAAFVAGVLIGAPLDPYVADDNIRMSARFLSHLLTLTNGDVNMALAGYYQGLTSVRRDGMKATTAAYVNVVLVLQGRF